MSAQGSDKEPDIYSDRRGIETINNDNKKPAFTSLCFYLLGLKKHRMVTKFDRPPKQHLIQMFSFTDRATEGHRGKGLVQCATASEQQNREQYPGPLTSYPGSP